MTTEKMTTDYNDHQPVPDVFPTRAVVFFTFITVVCLTGLTVSCWVIADYIGFEKFTELFIVAFSLYTFIIPATAFIGGWAAITENARYDIAVYRHARKMEV